MIFSNKYLQKLSKKNELNSVGLAHIPANKIPSKGQTDSKTLEKTKPKAVTTPTAAAATTATKPTAAAATTAAKPAAAKPAIKAVKPKLKPRGVPAQKKASVDGIPTHLAAAHDRQVKNDYSYMSNTGRKLIDRNAKHEDKLLNREFNVCKAKQLHAAKDGKWMTAKDLGASYGILPTTLSRLSKEGIVLSQRSGTRTVLYSETTVQAFLNSNV